MAENKKYYWLKLKENFFEEKQIKYLRKLPEGDKITICYLKMQLKSLRTEGFIKYDRILPSNVEELAMILDEEPNIVNLMIQALLKVTAIEILDDGSFYMLAMQDLIGKEGESAERVRKFREKQKKLPLQCNTDVTKCNTEIEKEIELDIEKEKKTEKITKCYEENIGMITPAVAEILFSYIDDSLSEELICQAIKIATLNNKRSMNYIRGILNSWNNKGYKVLADVQNEEKKEQKEDKKVEIKKAYQDYEQRDFSKIDFNQFYAN